MNRPIRELDLSEFEFNDVHQCIDEKIEALYGLYILLKYETNLPQCAANGVTSECGRDEGIERAGQILEKAREILVQAGKQC